MKRALLAVGLVLAFGSSVFAFFSNNKTKHSLLSLFIVCCCIFPSYEAIAENGTGEILREVNTTLGKNFKDLISSEFKGVDELINMIISIVKNTPLGVEGQSGEATQEPAATQEAAKEIVETVPISIPSAESAVAHRIVVESPSQVARIQNMLACTQAAKMQLMEQYASFIAKYSGESSPYRGKTAKILDEVQALADNTKQYVSDAPKRKVEETLLRVATAQTAMLGYQNVLLANLMEAIADEIVLLSKIGLAETEEYAGNLRDTMKDNIEIYDRVRGTIR